MGVQEILLILVIALIVFGPKRLPEIGRTLGKAMSEFRRATTDIRSTVEREIQKIEEEPRRIESVSATPNDGSSEKP